MTKLGHGSIPSRIKDMVRSLGRSPKPAHDGKPIVIGHRGADREAPENTRRSFECAIERGATAVEVDVCRTRDGRFVLWHDPDPRKTIAVARQLGEKVAYIANEPHIGHSCRKPISELTYEEFITHYGYNKRKESVEQVLEAGSPEIPPEPFESLLDFAANEPRLLDVFVDVKLRDDQLDDARELARLIETSNERARAPTRFHMLTVEVEVLEVLRSATLESKVYGDFEHPGVLEIARELGLRHISMGCGQRPWGGFFKEVCDVVESGEVDSVIVWTINEEEALRALIKAGVHGIITDEPAFLRSLLPR
jgi:glycerophosphoryl diester phosphodiesterase